VLLPGMTYNLHSRQIFFKLPFYSDLFHNITSSPLYCRNTRSSADTVYVKLVVATKGNYHHKLVPFYINRAGPWDVQEAQWNWASPRYGHKKYI